MKKITYNLGDLSNGEFASYETESEAMLAFEEAIADGTLANIQVIGEEGCPWQTEEDAREAAEEFFYVLKRTIEFDWDGDIFWEDCEIVAGNIQ